MKIFKIVTLAAGLFFGANAFAGANVGPVTLVPATPVTNDLHYSITLDCQATLNVSNVATETTPINMGAPTSGSPRTTGAEFTNATATVTATSDCDATLTWSSSNFVSDAGDTYAAAVGATIDAIVGNEAAAGTGTRAITATTGLAASTVTYKATSEAGNGALPSANYISTLDFTLTAQ